MDKNSARRKKKNLIRHLEELDSLLVAFSGGVDSSFLLAVSHEICGGEVVAATAKSITFPKREHTEACKFVLDRGIRHIVFQSDEYSLPAFIANGPDRCYHCKKALSQRLIKIAAEKGIRHVAHAANLDDLQDYRPGMKAAHETGIIAPLVDARLNKEEIRFLSKEMGLDVWDKPSMACLASRIPYESPITEQKLRMVDEAEEFLVKQGFKQCRVRHHTDVARIEVEPDETERIIGTKLRKQISEEFKRIGFLHIAVDLEGYVSGNLNRALN